MAWTIVAIVLLAAVGPLLWLLPSRRQRQQAEWRTAARRHGLAVELAAVENPDAVRAACRAYPGRVVVGIDARDGRVATEGWVAKPGVAAAELAAEFETAGVAAFVYTDIDRDGAMAGPNVEATEAFVERTGVPVIASGGVASLADLAALKRLGPRGLDGVISGRALYDGRIVPAAALELMAA